VNDLPWICWVFDLLDDRRGASGAEESTSQPEVVFHLPVLEQRLEFVLSGQELSVPTGKNEFPDSRPVGLRGVELFLDFRYNLKVIPWLGCVYEGVTLHLGAELSKEHERILLLMIVVLEILIKDLLHESLGSCLREDLVCSSQDGIGVLHCAGNGVVIRLAEFEANLHI
jgi:hypothetical protein